MGTPSPEAVLLFRVKPTPGVTNLRLTTSTEQMTLSVFVTYTLRLATDPAEVMQGSPVLNILLTVSVLPQLFSGAEAVRVPMQGTLLGRTFVLVR